MQNNEEIKTEHPLTLTLDLKDFQEELLKIDEKLNIKNYHDNGIYSVCLGDNYIDVAIPPQFAKKEDWVIYNNFPTLGGEMELTHTIDGVETVYRDIKFVYTQSNISQILEGSNIEVLSDALPVHLKVKEGEIKIRHNLKTQFGEPAIISCAKGIKPDIHVLSNKEYYLDKVKRTMELYNTNIEYKSFIDNGRKYE